MRRAFVACLSIGLWLCAAYFPVVAQTQTSCTNTEAFLAKVATDQNVASINILTGKPLLEAIEIYNIVPPQTDAQYDVAIVIGFMSRSGILVVGHGAEVCALVPFDPAHFEALKRSLLGFPA